MTINKPSLLRDRLDKMRELGLEEDQLQLTYTAVSLLLKSNPEYKVENWLDEQIGKIVSSRESEKRAVMRSLDRE